jgi:hypothetical protein
MTTVKFKVRFDRGGPGGRTTAEVDRRRSDVGPTERIPRIARLMALAIKFMDVLRDRLWDRHTQNNAIHRVISAIRRAFRDADITDIGIEESNSRYRMTRSNGRPMSGKNQGGVSPASGHPVTLLVRRPNEWSA